MSSRQTIDFGIDLGTTNSSIAVATGIGTTVIRNSLESELTPSAIFVPQNGQFWIGHHAKSKLTDERAASDVAIEFKRRIGTGQPYSFKASGLSMTPEELSAEVLKSLRADVDRNLNEVLTSAVITVPAAFELHQCEATKRAADIAGFKQAVLLQEPVAAALAYGYQKLDAKGYWLVFDFGGGTFDAALVSSRDGTMVVTNHGGDNFLGGSDIDWAIVEKILIPRLRKDYKTDTFGRGVERHKNDLIRLKAAAETAKIELSRKPSIFLEATLNSVAARLVNFETEITRDQIAAAAEPIIDNAVKITQRVLREKNVPPTAIENLIFVGGPTIAPYFREQVKARLGMPMDTGVDPMTAVARGAAIFARTQPRQRIVGVGLSRPKGEFVLEVVAKPVGSDLEPLLGGRILAKPGTSLAGYTIEMVNEKTKWRSGKQTLKAEAVFQFTARAERGEENSFLFELRTISGITCPLDNDRFSYTVGVVVEEQPIINNLGVAMADNKVSVHFTKGQVLPAKSTKTYRTSLPLRRGDSGQLLRIPVIEGGREWADRNLLIGSVEINASNLRRDLPVGSEVEVTLHMDTSRLLTVQAYVPMLDEEFPAKIELGGKARCPDAEVLRNELQRETARLAEFLQRAQVAPAQVLARIQVMSVSPLKKNLDERLFGEAANDDFEVVLKAERELMEFKDQLDGVETLLAWPVALQEAEKALTELTKIADNEGDAEDQLRLRTLRAEITQAISGKSIEKLRLKTKECSEVHAAILYRQPVYWTGYLEHLALNVAQMRDQPKAEQLLKKARAIASNPAQLDELKEAVYQLQELLPRQVADEARRGYGSGLLV